VASLSIAAAAEEPESVRTELNSFEAQRSRLKVGQRIRVTDQNGQSERGTVVAVSSDALVIGASRWLGFARDELTFSKDSVQAIHMVDSTGNGVGALVAVEKTYDRSSDSGRITIAPWISQHQKGVMAQIRF
jgi:hypothetical protein